MREYTFPVQMKIFQKVGLSDIVHPVNKFLYRPKYVNVLTDEVYLNVGTEDTRTLSSF